MNNDKSVYPELEAGKTKMNFYAGYKIYDSVSSGVRYNQVSNVKTISVMDGAMNLAASAVVAATALLAF